MKQNSPNGWIGSTLLVSNWFRLRSLNCFFICDCSCNFHKNKSKFIAIWPRWICPEKSVLRNSVPEIIPASSSKHASSECHSRCTDDFIHAKCFYNRHTTSKIKSMTYEARLFKGLNRSSTLRLVPGWWDQKKQRCASEQGREEYSESSNNIQRSH